MNISIQTCLFHIQIGIAVWMTCFSHLNEQEMDIFKILLTKVYLKSYNLNGYTIYIENLKNVKRFKHPLHAYNFTLNHNGLPLESR